jgi:hypothetical protein
MFNNDYTGTKPALGYGSAMLLDAEGKRIRIYDGANGQYWINGAQGTKPSGYSGGDYTTVAWKELAETPGGTLIICAQNAPTDLRAWVRGFRSATYFNQVMALVEIK